MSTPSGSKRILVGVDGSASSIGALRRGAIMADALGAQLEAMMVWEYPSVMLSYEPAAQWSPESDSRQVLEKAVTKAFPHGRPPGLTITWRVGSPAKTLIEESKNAAMLVLGGRGHGGFAGLLLGSVSSTCAEHAHCPVLIMHPEVPKTADGRA
jgi:nucleotide-binding universal stress UspA family protein